VSCGDFSCANRGNGSKNAAKIRLKRFII